MFEGVRMHALQCTQLEGGSKGYGAVFVHALSIVLSIILFLVSEVL